MEVAPLPHQLDALPDLDAPPSPDPTGGAHEPDAHLIRPAHTPLDRDVDCLQRVAKSPVFQASCSASCAFSCRGRGTFGLRRSRSSRLYMPPSVYVTPRVSVTQARIASAFRKRRAGHLEGLQGLSLLYPRARRFSSW